jgi:small-conductance mechanosensitive channel
VAELFATGRIVDLILALVVLETVLLVAWRWRTGGGLALIDIAANLAAGAFLMLALRSALVGDPWTMIVPWLLAGLTAHLFDLWRRWPRAR